jgi:hypothetical protein
MDDPRVLLIHLGGLGDVCLSESVFLSLSRHFPGNLLALGYTRFLGLFPEYFAGIERIESMKWLCLFSERPSNKIWERIVFIGKDREGRLRERWQRLSREPLLFIDMYPDGSSGPKMYIEEYQLHQLHGFEIAPVRKQVTPRPGNRVILYPEVGFRKSKWPPEGFVSLYRRLTSKGMDPWVLEALGLTLDVENRVVLQELTDVKRFFLDGGIFVSNDSGMAHLAGACGLFTVTIFTDFDPAVWHPRGQGITLHGGGEAVDVPAVEAKIMEAAENW